PNPGRLSHAADAPRRPAALADPGVEVPVAQALADAAAGPGPPAGRRPDRGILGHGVHALGQRRGPDAGPAPGAGPPVPLRPGPGPLRIAGGRVRGRRGAAGGGPAGIARRDGLRRGPVAALADAGA